MRKEVTRGGIGSQSIGVRVGVGCPGGIAGNGQDMSADRPPWLIDPRAGWLGGVQDGKRRSWIASLGQSPGKAYLGAHCRVQRE